MPPAPADYAQTEHENSCFVARFRNGGVFRSGGVTQAGAGGYSLGRNLIQDGRRL
jgi:hypothetical protein